MSVGFYVARVQSAAVIGYVKRNGNLIGCHSPCACEEGHVSTPTAEWAEMP